MTKAIVSTVNTEIFDANVSPSEIRMNHLLGKMDAYKSGTYSPVEVEENADQKAARKAYRVRVAELVKADAEASRLSSMFANEDTDSFRDWKDEARSIAEECAANVAHAIANKVRPSFSDTLVPNLFANWCLANKGTRARKAK